MKITSLKLSKIYSFGPCQTLEGFSDFNLFIGPNGSGKSNVLRVLDGLPYDMKYIGKNLIPNQTHIPDIANRKVDSFIPMFGEMSNKVINKETWMSNIKGCMEINYEVYSNGPPSTKRISCSENSDGHMQFNCGDIFGYSRKSRLLRLPETEHDFFKDRSIFFGNNPTTRLPFLNLGLYYIFGLHYRFLNTGSFIQGKYTNGGTVENSSSSLPSGVEQVAKLLTQILIAQDVHVLLIDEPELHLEARYIRRLFEFLIWYSLRSKNHSTKSEELISDSVNRQLLWNRLVYLHKI